MNEQRFKPSKYACHTWDTKTDKDYYVMSENVTCQDMIDEIENLEKEKEGWKYSCCAFINADSVLSMDCQIVQEAIFDLEKAINNNKNNTKNEQIYVENCLLNLKQKFNELNNHRIRALTPTKNWVIDDDY